MTGALLSTCTKVNLYEKKSFVRETLFLTTAKIKNNIKGVKKKWVNLF